MSVKLSQAVRDRFNEITERQYFGETWLEVAHQISNDLDQDCDPRLIRDLYSREFSWRGDAKYLNVCRWLHNNHSAVVDLAGTGAGWESIVAFLLPEMPVPPAPLALYVMVRDWERAFERDQAYRAIPVEAEIVRDPEVVDAAKAVEKHELIPNEDPFVSGEELLKRMHVAGKLADTLHRQLYLLNQARSGYYGEISRFVRTHFADIAVWRGVGETWREIEQRLIEDGFTPKDGSLRILYGRELARRRSPERTVTVQ